MNVGFQTGNWMKSRILFIWKVVTFFIESMNEIGTVIMLYEITPLNENITNGGFAECNLIHNHDPNI